MKIAVVLNFNNYKSTISCTTTLIASDVDKVVIVDNGSNNDSYKYLKRALSESKNVDILYSSKNKGYASGNNIGLKYIESKYGLDNVIYIVNPDVKVNRHTVNQIAQKIHSKKNIGMVTTRVNNSMRSVWKHTGLLRGYIFNLFVFSRIVYKLLGLEERKFYKRKNDFQRVDVVSGAFFGINQRVFKTIGYFDNKTFLYYEEEILYCKLKKIGVSNFIITSENYIHAEQGSTNLSLQKIKRINDESKLYYLTQYDGAGLFYVKTYKFFNKLDGLIIKMLNK